MLAYLTRQLIQNYILSAWYNRFMAYAENVEALVFSRRSVGEADRLVTLFTREKGLIRVMAKGVRKIPSKRGGHLESFTRVQATVADHGGRWWLSAVETRDYLAALHQLPEALMSAQTLARTVTSLFEFEVAYVQVYDQVRQAWEVLPRADKSQRDLVELTTLAHLLREAGVMSVSMATQIKRQLAESGDDLSGLLRKIRLYASRVAFAVQS